MDGQHKFGKRVNVAEIHKQYFVDAGFVGVYDDMDKVMGNPVDKSNPPDTL